MSRIREVRKRDGRVVPFDRDKIADAIDRAFRAVGEGDRSLVGELAAAVEHFLASRLAVRPGSTSGSDTFPDIEDIQDIVETVLMEMGHPRAAKAYILYRQKRATLRATLEVRTETTRSAGEPPHVEESDVGVVSWSKGRISAALIREADLDPAVAEEIATAVETRVLQSGIRRISTALVRELVDNELFERGYDAKLRRHAPVGLSPYDLDRMIFADDTKSGYAYAKTPAEARDLVAGRIFRQYSLAEGYSADVASAHRDGCIHIHGLEDPLRLERATWTVPKEDSETLEDLAARLSRLAPFIGGSIRLEGLAGRFAGGSPDSSIDDLVRRFPSLEIVGGSGPQPQPSELRLAVGKITLNLPRVALWSSSRNGAVGRSGEGVEARLAASIDLAVKGLLERRRFVARLAARPEAPLWQLADQDLERRAELIVGVVGLAECVRFLEGAGLSDEESRRRGSDLLAFIELRVGSGARQSGANLLVEDTAEPDVGKRLAQSDARLYGRPCVEYGGDSSGFRGTSCESQAGPDAGRSPVTEVEMSREFGE